MHDEAVFERLIASGEVFDILQAEHQRRDSRISIEACKHDIIDTLLSRLTLGTLEAWASSCMIDTTRDYGRQSFNEIISTFDFHMSKELSQVPQEFWAHFYNAHSNNRKFNPITGDFSYEYYDEYYGLRTGVAHGVTFDHRGLPPIAMSFEGAIPRGASEQPVDPIPGQRSRNGGGRTPAKGWADFAEELAVYIHETGLPPGEGAMGESAMFAAIAGRLSARGRECPSRTTLQPVINAVLRRLREG